MKAVIAQVGKDWTDVTAQVLDMIGAEEITDVNRCAAECAAETLAESQGDDWVFGVLAH